MNKLIIIMLGVSFAYLIALLFAIDYFVLVEPDVPIALAFNHGFTTQTQTLIIILILILILFLIILILIFIFLHLNVLIGLNDKNFIMDLGRTEDKG